MNLPYFLRRRVLPFISCFITLLVPLSCHDGSHALTKAQLNFSISTPPPSVTGGRAAQSPKVPAAAIISIHDGNGNAIQTHYKVALTEFGGSFLSLPILFDVTSQQTFYLSEFIVVDSSDSALYATPKEGSALAHLVSDPLDIKFNVSPNETTTVTPEVLAIGNSLPQDFGYAEFGFKIVSKIEIVLSAFIQQNSIYKLTNAHAKVEGLQDSTSTTPIVLWNYETDISAKATIVGLKKSSAYRITVTKDGYNVWTKVMDLNPLTSVDVYLEDPAAGVDIYVGAYQFVTHQTTGPDLIGKYWKNGSSPIVLGGLHSSVNHIVAHNNDIYATGSDSNIGNALYWKNGQRVDLPFVGRTGAIAFSGDDFYLAGGRTNVPGQTAMSTAFYMKNGAITDLLPATAGRNTSVTGMAIDKEDVYVCGFESAIPKGSTNTYNYPLLWKNGQVSTLQYPSDPNYQELTLTRPVDIAVKNGHVYIAGNFYYGTIQGWIYTIGYWKDGQVNIVPPTPAFSEESYLVNDMVVTDSEDIYLAGNHINHVRNAVYWKNGVPTIVGTDTGSGLSGIEVIGENIYLCGDVSATVNHSGSNATYWINGKSQVCEGPSTYTTAFCVVPRK